MERDKVIYNVDSFKKQKDYDTNKYEIILFHVSTKTFDAIGNGSKDRLVRNVSDEVDALQIFESKDGHLLPNMMFSNIRKKWKYDDMNDGNCPFQLKKSRFLALTCDYYNKTVIYSIDDSISIQANSSNTLWQVTIPIGTLLKKI